MIESNRTSSSVRQCIFRLLRLRIAINGILLYLKWYRNIRYVRLKIVLIFLSNQFFNRFSTSTTTSVLSTMLHCSGGTRACMGITVYSDCTAYFVVVEVGKSKEKKSYLYDF